MYAVIELKGHQYIVKQGDKITVDNVDMEVGNTLDAEKVVLKFDENGENVEVGSPYLSSAKVELKVLENTKGEKIDVLKFKRKTRYQRKIGFRAHLSILQVEKIS